MEDRENKQKQGKNEKLNPTVTPKSMNPTVNKPPVKIHPGMVPGKTSCVGNSGPTTLKAGGKKSSHKPTEPGAIVRKSKVNVYS